MTEQDQSPPEFCFALARGQNQFFVELAEALAYELDLLGVKASVEIGEVPLPRSGLVHVFLPPHEYVSLSRYRPPAPHLMRSIVISAEQPDSHFFDANVPLARDAGAVFDINPRSVRAYASEGIEASLLELGHTRLWDRFRADFGARGEVDGADDRPRDIDILFLGRVSPRRERALASYAGIFERFRCHLGLSDNSRPNVATGATFVAGDDKRELLGRSKVLLNIHGEDEPYFEWLRIAEAICAGCAIVSEHSSDFAPLQWGRHLLTGELGSLGLFCAQLVEDDAGRERMRTEAYELLVQERPMSKAARQLIAAGLAADKSPVGRDLELVARQERARGHFRENPPVLEHQPHERADLSAGDTLVLRTLKHQLLAVAALRRQLAQLQYGLRPDTDGEPQTRIVAESAAWSEDRPRGLSVVVPLYNHRGDVLSALESLERSSRVDWEAVIVDDASTDRGGEAVRSWLESHPHLSCRLVAHDLNRGLPAARNTGIGLTRADRLLMLDADNEVRPGAMSRLMAALDDDREASFAYGIMERFSVDGPTGLLSCFGWDPERLRSSNYIDAFALVRRDALAAMGGYSEDSRVFGWEDYDLWVRMAEAGRHGVFVPEIIARYQVGHSSMISLTNVSTADAYAALVDHAPKLMAGLRIPR
ncbi:MAG TPA: glycosyltransferase family 2 protein [Solirubrobacteraceae bacterium]|nr:glycosyltransferase family 2 protein [Solirubrobacteraceae bacterium]